MAFTYVYGDYKLERTINVNYRPWYAYEISSSATTYSVTIYAGAQISGNTGPVVQSGFTLTLSGTGQETRSITTSFSTHNADSSKRDTFLGSKTWTWSKGKTSSTKTITATLSKSNYTTSSVTRTFTVPALASYTVSYNLNGGQGNFSNQKKYYNIALQIWPGENARPVKTGYTFTKWKSTGGYYYDPGDYYTGNANTVMTAQWTEKTYTVKYNANGGSYSGSNNTVTVPYSQNHTVWQGTDFSRSGYVLSGWNTQANGGGTSYSKGSTYTGKTNITLYAQWTLGYTAATLTNLTAWRTDSNHDKDFDGVYVAIRFNYTLPKDNSGNHSLVATIKSSFDGETRYTSSELTTNTSTPLTCYIGGTYSKDSAIDFSVTLTDQTDQSKKVTKTVRVGPAIYPIDLLATSGDIYMGIMTPAVPGKPLQVGEIGTIVSGTRTSTAGSVGTSYTTVATISLPAGVWLITAYNSFNGGTAGRRSILITATSDATYDAAEGNSSTYASTNHCCLKSSLIVSPTTTTTYYLRAKSSTTVDSPEGNLKAVRIM